MSHFNLQSLVSSVARTDPATGEKINKMRKSYEGKVKALRLAGRNRAVKNQPGKSMGLLEMAQWPEEEWVNQKVHGRPVQAGLSDAALAKLDKAMQMQSGPVPNTNEYDWDDLLGTEKIKPLPTVEERSKKALSADPSKSKVNGQVNGAHVPANAVAAAEVTRPKRAGKKRRYDEDSFEGYGEGYNDDIEDRQTHASGYSSGENSRTGSGAKKRRKVASLRNRRPMTFEQSLMCHFSGIRSRQFCTTGGSKRQLRYWHDRHWYRRWGLWAVAKTSRSNDVRSLLQDQAQSFDHGRKTFL